MRLLPLCLAVLLAACRTAAPDHADHLRHEHDGDVPVASGAATGADALDVTRETVAYATVGGRAVSGTLVRPGGREAEALPGVVVIHEWWGLNDNVRDQAALLAAEGYAVLAVDLYGGQAAATPDEAMALMRAVDAGAARETLRQAAAYLRQASRAPRVAALGWCFGGRWALLTGLDQPDALDAVVVYYGNPETDAAALRGLGRTPVLAHFGEADRSIPLPSVEAFRAGLAGAGVPHTVHVYPGADHAFANPSGTRFEPAAAALAWGRTTAFLAEALGG